MLMKIRNFDYWFVGFKFILLLQTNGYRKQEDLKIPKLKRRFTLLIWKILREKSMTLPRMIVIVERNAHVKSFSTNYTFQVTILESQQATQNAMKST